MNGRRLFAMLPILAAALSAGEGDRVFRSGPAQVALIEHFTNEGCSSCPPAEKWRNELKDALASKPFTARQHAYAGVWRVPARLRAQRRGVTAAGVAHRGLLVPLQVAGGWIE